ncbi:hypothetical protein H0H93_008319 [Arthromyces matolae]|nr:hypothetical protein H0H93_008319 [Arthromyces matolae]
MQIATLSKIQIPIWLAYVLIYSYAYHWLSVFDRVLTSLSDWADFNIPTAFGPRVRNALKAEARSVRLAGLVGAGGLWYGFGKTIGDILAEEQANEFSELLTKAGRSFPPTETPLYRRPFRLSVHASLKSLIKHNISPPLVPLEVAELQGIQHNYSERAWTPRNANCSRWLKKVQKGQKNGMKKVTDLCDDGALFINGRRKTYISFLAS